MNCQNCSAPLEPEARFCGECGTPVPAPEPSVAAPTRCLNCGAALEPAYKFCGECGHRVGQSPTPRAEPHDHEATGPPTVTEPPPTQPPPEPAEEGAPPAPSSAPTLSGAVQPTPPARSASPTVMRTPRQPTRDAPSAGPATGPPTPERSKKGRSGCCLALIVLAAGIACIALLALVAALLLPEEVIDDFIGTSPNAPRLEPFALDEREAQWDFRLSLAAEWAPLTQHEGLAVRDTWPHLVADSDTLAWPTTQRTAGEVPCAGLRSALCLTLDLLNDAYAHDRPSQAA